jgi:hypothetical protein
MKKNGGHNGDQVQVSSMSRNQCIWMKAGVVDFRTCDNAFDCTSCTFDKAISRQSVQQPTALGSWKEVMRNPNLNKECRHMLTGRVPFKLCSHNYECKDCAYDQLLYEYGQLLGEEDMPVHAAQVIQVAAVQMYGN